MPRRRYWAWAGALAICLALAGCDASQPVASSTTTATPVPIATPTAPLATATSTPALTTFTCGSVSTGSTKLFNDTAMRLSFSYPAAWTENSCQRIQGPDSQQTLIIGNLFSVTMVPRSGQSIHQWVQYQANQYEVVTLGALTVQHAHEAATISVNPSATSDPSKPFDAEPLAQTFAIVAGSQSFYIVNGFIAQMSVTDTTPNLSRQQLAQQVVSTFIVA